MAERRYWKGTFGGSNRGVLWIRTAQSGAELSARCLLHDVVYGSAIAILNGTIEGASARLELVRHKPFGPAQPVRMEVTFSFSSDSRTAYGMWRTDVGTAGDLRIAEVPRLSRTWVVRSVCTDLVVWMRARFAAAYLLSLIAIAFGAVVGAVELGTPLFLLLLIPAPFVLQKTLARTIDLLRGLNVRKIGPLEFSQAPLDERTQQLAGMLDQQAQRASAFLVVDTLLALFTKLMLLWLLNGGGEASRDDFDAQARTLGILDDQLGPTIDAMLKTGCAAIDASTGRIRLTSFGQDYAQHLSRALGSSEGRK